MKNKSFIKILYNLFVALISIYFLYKNVKILNRKIINNDYDLYILLYISIVLLFFVSFVYCIYQVYKIRFLKNNKQ